MDEISNELLLIRFNIIEANYISAMKIHGHLNLDFHNCFIFMLGFSTPNMMNYLKKHQWSHFEYYTGPFSMLYPP